MIVLDFRREFEVGAKECAAQFGDEFLVGIAFVAPGLAAKVAFDARRSPEVAVLSDTTKPGSPVSTR